MGHVTAAVIDKFDTVRHGFFDRQDGLSKGQFASRNVNSRIGDSPEEVKANKQLCLDDLGISQAELIFANKLAHSNAVYVVQPGDKTQDLEDYDAIISDQPGIAIGLSTADCLPILLVDESARAVAVIHAGWRGLVAGVITAAVKAMHDQFGIEAQDLIAAVGPAIAAENYEVGDDVTVHFESQFIQEINGSKHLDLFKVAESQLRQAGVHEVEMLNIDVFANEDFYSYRRDKGQTGRHMSMIALV